LTAAVSDRVQKQSDVGHWERKLRAEEAGIKAKEESVAVTQKEFEVCRRSLDPPLISVVDTDSIPFFLFCST
jgi:hypothetical protein